MDSRPILTFDTSAINRLLDDPEQEAMIPGLMSGFMLRLTFTSVNEVASNSDPERRDRLLQVCKRILPAGELLLPSGEVLQKLVYKFRQDPYRFEWGSVDVRADESVEAVLRNATVSNDLSNEVREEANWGKEKFKRFLAKAKSPFDKVFTSNPNARHGSVDDLVAGLKGGRQYLKIAQSLYGGLDGETADDEMINKFLRTCPPFQCVVDALCVALYDRDVRLPNTPGSLKAGWADTFMAAYLPYCDQFVTADSGQLACYRQVAMLGNFNLAIQSWNSFRRDLCLI